MKPVVSFIVALLSVCVLHAQPAGPQLNLQPQATHIDLSWPGNLPLPSGATAYPLYQLQQSSNLLDWVNVGPKQKGKTALTQLSVGIGQPKLFYRLNAEWGTTAEAPMGTGGSEVFGYNVAFAAELQQVGQISPQQFAARYGVTNVYLPSIDGDVTTARYWNLFATDPATNNVGMQPTNHGYRYHDLRLNSNELAILQDKGFVVSERLASTNFAQSFYALWNDDLPVFVSADSILHAWHRSYDNMLVELEHLWLSQALEQILDGMAAQITVAQQEAATGPLAVSVLDADYYVTVARSLLKGSKIASSLGQAARVQQTLDAINSEAFTCFTFFDYPRNTDFSQFKPRGHYEQSERLRRYFRTTMWLGRIDFRIAGGDQDCDGNPLPPSTRQLGTAITLGRLLALSGKYQAWVNFDKVTQTFVGWTDSMTFAHLADLTVSAGISTLAAVTTTQQLADVQTQIGLGTLGVQNIRGDAFVSPVGPEQLRLPRSFTVFGQKFVPDSWALSKVTSDSILWVENGVTNKIPRRVPSALDVAFSTLGNDQIVPELIALMTNTAAQTSTNHMIYWRDGLPYQHNLAAARNVLASQTTEAWESNIYLSWLSSLRALSVPTTDAYYPQAVRTREWALRLLNTQLASWTQLRHDTILYAKQSYSDVGLCSYPDAYVEPNVEFWLRFEQMIARTATLLQALPYEGTVSDIEHGNVDMANVKAKHVSFLTNFVDKVAQLRVIADQQTRQEPLTVTQTNFMHQLMQTGVTNYGPVRRYDGWYPSLFYRHMLGSASYTDTFPIDFGAQKYDALVADVHTDPPHPELGDPGSILHQGVGKVNLLFMVFERGPNRIMVAGPVLSHYEFETPFPQRLSDNEWKTVLDSGTRPPSPEWTQGYLVPTP